MHAPGNPAESAQASRAGVRIRLPNCATRFAIALISIDCADDGRQGNPVTQRFATSAEEESADYRDRDVRGQQDAGRVAVSHGSQRVRGTECTLPRAFLQRGLRHYRVNSQPIR